MDALTGEAAVSHVSDNPHSVKMFLCDPNVHVAFSPIRNPISSSTQLISSDVSGFNPAHNAAR